MSVKVLFREAVVICKTEKEQNIVQMFCCVLFYT